MIHSFVPSFVSLYSAAAAPTLPAFLSYTRSLTCCGREKKGETRVDVLFIQINSWRNSSLRFYFYSRPTPTRARHKALMWKTLRFRYTWNGKNSQYPMIKTIRYPRYNTPNPSVTCFVVNLNVLKYISLIPLILPEHLDGDFYIGNMFWISNVELTLTYTSRDQTLSSTVLCKAPQFECVEVSRILIFHPLMTAVKCDETFQITSKVFLPFPHSRDVTSLKPKSAVAHK